MKTMALLLLIVVSPLAICVGEGRFFGEVRGPVEEKDRAVFVADGPYDSAIDGEMPLEIDLLFDSTMREAQLKLSREMGTDPLFSGR